MTSEEIKNEKAAFDAQYEISLQELRAGCTHGEHEIMYFSWRVGCMDPKSFCKFCGEMLGEPNPEEYIKFKQKELDETRATWATNYPDMEFPEVFERRFKDHIENYFLLRQR